jgi:hypothetical protein
MQAFIRRKNIENLTRQLAGGRLDEAQRTFAEQRLSDEISSERADELTSAQAHAPVPDAARC